MCRTHILAGEVVVIWVCHKLLIDVSQIAQIVRRLLIKEHIQLLAGSLHSVVIEACRKRLILRIYGSEQRRLGNAHTYSVKLCRARELLIQLTEHTAYLAIAPRRALLTWGVPLHLWLVDRADVGNIKSLLHQMLRDIDQILGIVIVAIVTKVGTTKRGGIALAIFGQLHQRRVREEYKLIATAILGRLHKILLTGTLAPIVTLAVHGLI